MVERDVQHSLGWQFDPWLLVSTCWSAVGQDTEPQVKPDVQGIVLRCTSIAQSAHVCERDKIMKYYVNCYGKKLLCKPSPKGMET